jgi:hypothetical protein
MNVTLSLARIFWRAALLPLLLLALPTPAQAEDFTYATNNGTIAITWYTGSGGDVTIPSTINGLPVTRIGEGAFGENFSVTRITLPNSVTSVGAYAFAYCYGLTNINIPASVTDIGDDVFGLCINLPAITVHPLNSFYSSVNGVLFNKNQTILLKCPAGKPGAFSIPNTVNTIEDNAFAYCIGLSNITVPSSVTHIGSSAFSDCTGLTAITVDALNSFYSSVDGVLYNKSQATLIQCPAGKPGSHTLPNSVTNIGDQAFASCARLTNIILSARVASIGDYAFAWCTSLTTLIMPASLINISDRAFNYCSVTGVYFQGNAPSVGLGVFDGDDDAIVYYLPGTTGWGETFGGRPTALWSVAVPFNYTTNHGTITIAWYTGSASDVIIPSTIHGLPVTAIESCAFCERSLTSITIPDSVTNIGQSAFSAGTTLNTITVDVRNPSYSSADGVLFNKNQTLLIQCPVAKAGSYLIPSSVCRVGGWAFFGCSGLTGVAIPSSVTEVGDGAFAWCDRLTNIVIPGTVTAVPFQGFDTCTNLASVTIGQGVTQIAGNAFHSCTHLATVNIPASVTSIGDSAFYQCASLTNVIVPHSVASIGLAAFAYCPRLREVHFEGSAPRPGSLVFDGDDAATVYYLPGSTGWGTTFGGRPTALWWLPNPVILNSGPGFGVRTNRFGFVISWATNATVRVEASATLVNPTWLPVATNTLAAGWSYFCDPRWTNQPARFYRLGSP